MEELFKEIVEWAEATFPRSTPESIVNHLKEEILELEAKNNDPLEIADCVIMLFHLAHKHNIDVYSACKTKFNINLQRKWNKPNELGFCTHIKEN